MLSALKALAKNPYFWGVAVVVALAVTAYSVLRKPFKAVAAKLPGSDVQ